MDPDTCWQTICALIARERLTLTERTELAGLLEALATWIATGGFAPRPLTTE